MASSRARSSCAAVKMSFAASPHLPPMALPPSRGRNFSLMATGVFESITCQVVVIARWRAWICWSSGKSQEPRSTLRMPSNLFMCSLWVLPKSDNCLASLVKVAFTFCDSLFKRGISSWKNLMSSSSLFMPALAINICVSAAVTDCCTSKRLFSFSLLLSWHHWSRVVSWLDWSRILPIKALIMPITLSKGPADSSRTPDASPCWSSAESPSEPPLEASSEPAALEASPSSAAPAAAKAS
mmetsp:Transcript_76875/g.223209  ORF Transcript_76875/g.223209 Transcript_76875/m.223209 type:complete len:240 (+) Transcript_76875:469-1188(+)